MFQNKMLYATNILQRKMVVVPKCCFIQNRIKQNKMGGKIYWNYRTNICRCIWESQHHSPFILQQQTRNILALEFEMKHLQIEIKYQNAECIQRNIVLLNVMCLYDTLKINENNLHVKQSLRLCQAKSLQGCYKYKVQVTIPQHRLKQWSENTMNIM